MKCMMCENVKPHCKEEAIPELCNAVFRPSKSNIFEVGISASMNAPELLTSCNNEFNLVLRNYSGLSLSLMLN